MTTTAHPHDVGSRTRDLLDTHQALPTDHDLPATDHEHRLRHFGRRCWITGISLIAFAFTATQAGALIDSPTINTETNRMFGILGIVAVVTAGATLTALGGFERLNRPLRSMTRRALVTADENQQRLDVIIGLVGAVPGRLAALERVIEKVPAYGEGVILGAQLRSEALGPEVH